MYDLVLKSGGFDFLSVTSQIGKSKPPDLSTKSYICHFLNPNRALKYTIRVYLNARLGVKK